MDSYQSMLEKISGLQKKASALRENEKKRAVGEICKLIELYDIQPEELFSHNGRNSVKPSLTVRKSTRSKKNVARTPKYRDPATGKTWIGLGKRPRWLIGDKEAYLITAQEGASESSAKPKKTVSTKATPATPRKTRATTKAKDTGASKRATKRGSARKTPAPEVPAGAMVVAGESVSESVIE